jgi:endonuclease/exonuclease/phosphatase family metal-dependent hydrolase
MTLKLITYNIWHGKYLEEVIAFLHQEKPDVVCLQELGTKGRAFKVNDTNILKSLQEALDMEAVYAPMFEKQEENGIWDLGLAILSKGPIEETQMVQYAGGFKLFGVDEIWRYRWPSAILSGVIRGIPIITTHLTVTREAKVTPAQLRSASVVKEFIGNYPDMVFCGDMNTLPGSETYKVLADGLTDLTDHQGQTLHPTIHPVGKLGYHVDYVFAKGKKLKHISTRIPMINASDHLPVVVELELKQ